MDSGLLFMAAKIHATVARRITLRSRPAARGAGCGVCHTVRRFALHLITLCTVHGCSRPRGTMADMPEGDESAVRVVVAAVIERDGLILAARRTEPPALAGRWEFPGGKVEPGEDDAQALERECREEIGVRIAVGERIGPLYTIAGGSMVVRTYRAVIADGAEPEALDSHDALVWVRPGGPDVRDLPWLDGDLLILDALDGGELSPGVHQVA